MSDHTIARLYALVALDASVVLYQAVIIDALAAGVTADEMRRLARRRCASGRTRPRRLRGARDRHRPGLRPRRGVRAGLTGRRRTCGHGRDIWVTVDAAALIPALGWFGPRRLASVVFALLAVEMLGEAEQAPQEMIAAVAMTMVLSVILHGDRRSGRHRYGRRDAGMPVSDA